MKYVDSSAFVKYYANEDSEKGSNKVKELIDKAKRGNEKLISSVLLIPECVSSFDKWKRQRLLTKEEVNERLAIFVEDLKELVSNNGLVIEGINTFAVVFCIDYIVKHSLAVNDSFHLYSALLNKNEIEQFVCSDKMLLEAAKKEGLEVFNPEEERTGV